MKDVNNYNIEQIDNNFHITLVRSPIVSVSGALSVSSIVPPLSIAYLSASLRSNGFSITNIDAVGEGIGNISKVPQSAHMEYQGLSIEGILKRIHPSTKVLGVSCMFSLEWPFTRRIIKEIKRNFSDIKIIAGGEHVTALPEFVLSDCKEIDIVVLGEGEETIVDLATCLERDRNVEEVNGIVYRSGGKFTRTAPRDRIKKIDDICWPAWDLVPINTYLDLKLSHGPYRGRAMPILASRGCPYNCAFCSNAKMWHRSYIARSPIDVVNEIKHYIDKYKIKCIEFYDLTPIIKKSWIMEFCDLIIDNNLNFSWQISGGTRTEAIDEEVIVKVKKAGCQYLGFAPESGSPAVLKQIRKRLNLQRMVNLIKIAKKHKIATRTNFVIGFPNDTRRQIYQTLFFQMKLAFFGVLDSPIFEFTPYPGSEYFEFLLHKGVIPGLDDEYFESLGLNLQLKNKKSYCENVGTYELLIYRFMGMTVFYSIYYLFNPMKLLQFIKNLFWGNYSNSVFEQRIILNFKKRLLKLKYKNKS